MPRITHKRHFVQAALLVAALLLPFISLSGNPFLRMDIEKLTLYLAGIPLRIDQFFLLLLILLLFVVLFLLMTVILGRVWCGWLCPQTVFNDLSDLLARRFRAKFSPVTARLLEQVSALVIAKVIAFNLFCWFQPPGQVFRQLLNFTDHQPMFVTFLLLTLFGYINLILVKRSFCRSYCPYGRLQVALMDAGTLNLTFLEETRDSCLRCDACVRSCPMDVDIRTGFQIECISCGRCIDACRAVMEDKPFGVGLIGYRFGTVKGAPFKAGNPTLVLLGMTLLLVVGLVWGVSSRSQTAFAVQRVATADVRYLPDGSAAEPWRAIIGNRSETSRTYSIRVAGELPEGVELLGPVRDITIAANQHQEIIFMIHIQLSYRQSKKLRVQLFCGDTLISSVPITP